MDTVGEILKSARNDERFSIEEISKELNISKDLIINFENDKVLNHYDMVFYIGHLRSYCNFLNLDSDTIIDKYKKQISFRRNEVLEKIAKPNFNNNKFNFYKLVPSTLILLIFTSFYFLFIKEDNKSIEYALIPDIPENYIPIIEKESLKTSITTEDIKYKNNNDFASETNFTSANASNKDIETDNNLNITLKLLNPTWLQLRDESNNIIISKLMDKDEEYTYQMNLNYSITAGNAGNILVLIDSDVRGKIGKYGEVIDSIILDNNFNN